ncbi:MAG: serine hydrolase [Planctomycetes bacterium]|nr:serine hydrolase [Planctomycetota bacterium]
MNVEPSTISKRYWRSALTSLLALAGITLPTARAVDFKPDDALAGRLMPLVEAHHGKVAVTVKHLETGVGFSHRENEPQRTASLIKFPVMIETHRQAAEGKVDLDRPVTLRKEDQVEGSGILTQHFSSGATFALRDAVRLMIAYSDNTATNLVLDQIGIGSTAETMERLGSPNTKIHSKVFRRDTSVFPERSQRFGLGSTTAAEMLRLLESLHRKELVSVEASEAMLAHLRTCDDRNKFPRFLPQGAKIAFKTGSVSNARTAAGIIYAPAGPVALCVLTDDNQDTSWTPDNAGDRLCAEIAREVYEHFSSQ